MVCVGLEVKQLWGLSLGRLGQGFRVDLAFVWLGAGGQFGVCLCVVCCPQAEGEVFRLTTTQHEVRASLLTTPTQSWKL